ncbi:MAG: phenylacrylic acid decarboxylase [Bogoriella megaspora]|nr:MAG: phenylacrylic acid decarboxylase [Bogoriella megaspora]
MIILFLFLACAGGYLAASWKGSTSKIRNTILGILTSKLTGSSLEESHGAKGKDEESITSVIPAQQSSPKQSLSRRSSFSTIAQAGQLPTERPKRIVVAMTGATGAILGIRLLEKLRRLNIESHLVISKWADATISWETDYKLSQVKALATKTYSSRDVAAPISSGSFRVDGMIIVPCSMKTVSAVANGYAEDLIARAADVTIKERRKLVVVARETPLSGIHLDNLMKIERNGGVIFPPVPAFYTRPKTVEDIIDQSVGRMLDMFDIDCKDFERWDGMKQN